MTHVSGRDKINKSFSLFVMYPFLENGTLFPKDKLVRPNITIDLINYVLHKHGVKRMRGDLSGYFVYM